jgi:signal transduction histidine kinase
MTQAASFRRRLIVGSLLWIFGLLAITTVVAIAFIHRYPHLVGYAHNAALVTFATVCLFGGLSMVRRGLSPFSELRERLAAVHQGRDRRVEGRYPSEVQPLVDDLNALLEQRDHTVRRAIAKAGDLAHALKTPLAVLAHEAEVADGAGQGELAAVMRQQVERMRRQMDYHLAHARAAASGAAPGAHCAVLPSAEGLARTLLRLHADRPSRSSATAGDGEARGLAIQVDVDATHAVRVEREDLDEMLGNLLDNACKWARSRIAIASAETGGGIAITVDDDGPGLDASMRDAVLQRGVRADEAAPGSGLGLAIVRDLAELYGGSIALSASPSGGLRARLELPSRRPGPDKDGIR